MHDCLRSQELIQLIFDRIHDSDTPNDEPEASNYDSDAIARSRVSYTTRQSQLFALAQTCRSFRNLAIACLWKTIDDITPVIKCVGKDFWLMSSASEDVDGEGRRILRLSRPVSHSDIAIMKRYAQLVRHYGSRNWSDEAPGLAPDVWQALEQASSPSALFPNLQSIFLRHIEALEHSALFGTQRLTSFTLLTQLPRISSLLVEFSARCPDLKYVKLHWFGDEEDDGEDADADADDEREESLALKVFLNWKNVTHLVLTNGTLKVLQTLARQPNSLRCLEFKYKPLPLLSIPVGSFPTLERIIIGTFKISEAIQLADSLPTISNLQCWALHFHNWSGYQEQDWVELLQSLKKYSCSLKELDVQEKDNNHRFEVGKETHLSSALFFALVADFQALTRVRFVKLGGFKIVDDDMQNLTKEMPRLEEFYLYDCSKRSETGITIATLVFFAQNCLSLSSLGLQFDAQADKIPQESDPTPQASRLTKLDVWVSPIDDPDSVTVLLLKTFPKLQSMNWYDPSLPYGPVLPELDPEYSTAWSKVCGLLALKHDQTMRYRQSASV